MPDVEAVRRVARSKMGVLSRGATGEFAMLARLLAPDEPILAKAIGHRENVGRLFTGRLVVATPGRLLLIAKAMVTRRERVDEIPLARVRSARVVLPWTLSSSSNSTQAGCPRPRPPSPRSGGGDSSGAQVTIVRGGPRSSPRVPRWAHR